MAKEHIYTAHDEAVYSQVKQYSPNAKINTKIISVNGGLSWFEKETQIGNATIKWKGYIGSSSSEKSNHRESVRTLSISVPDSNLSDLVVYEGENPIVVKEKRPFLESSLNIKKEGHKDGLAKLFQFYFDNPDSHFLGEDSFYETSEIDDSTFMNLGERIFTPDDLDIAYGEYLEKCE